jgi:hypothetical protein
MMPWSDLLRAAAMLGVLPNAFWALSVYEWRALMGQSKGLDTARFHELYAAFPDQTPAPFTPPSENRSAETTEGSGNPQHEAYL